MQSFQSFIQRLSEAKVPKPWRPGPTPAMRAMSNEDWHGWANSKDPWERGLAAKYGPEHHLLKLVHDKHVDVRSNVVARVTNNKHGLLDILANDSSPEIREKLASHGYPHILTKLMHDSNPEVAYRVALHGDESHLKHLSNHDDDLIRSVVADRITSPSHLLTLATDKQRAVRERARDRLKELGLHETYDPENLPLHPDVESTIKSISNKAETQAICDKHVYSSDPTRRCWAARRTRKKSHLDYLINDANATAREYVAERGIPEHLDKLIKDPESWVRATVAMKTNNSAHLLTLATDSQPRVRKTARTRMEELGLNN